MGNIEKLGSLFTKDNEYLNNTEKKNLKDAFNIVQSNMRQSVFSFENEQLEKQGIYSSKTGCVDKAKLKNAIIIAMVELEKNKIRYRSDIKKVML